AIGLLLAAFNFLLGLILPGDVANILLLALLVLSSGGLHLDGLADTVDGTAGHRTPERRLEIMRDSRIGGFGAVSLIMVLLVQYILLNNLPDGPKWMALIAAPVVSRWALVYAIYAFPSARPDGLGKTFKEGVDLKQFWLATIITGLLVIGLWGPAGLVMWAVAFLSAVLTGTGLARMLRGLTGDNYGAIHEVALVFMFIMTVVLSYNNWLMRIWWF
ncbi:MAG TPA: adenosylcobinamide-GDP ribazoletransferase, partial [Dehalococcoidales bacterium]|nr:adenosylcobinamide-GDP ribazoletransferase [Dehalococcoidales bacterium]